MAIDITKGTHNVAFPSKVLAGMGGAHQFNITLTADHDNGELVARGAWTSFDNYLEGTIGNSNDFAGIIQAVNPDDSTQFYVELTADTTLLFVYNSPVSPYGERDFQDESLFYNETGDVVRAYTLSKGDIVSLSTNAFSGTPVVGKTLTYASGKYVVGA